MSSMIPERRHDARLEERDSVCGENAGLSHICHEGRICKTIKHGKKVLRLRNSHIILSFKVRMECTQMYVFLIS